MYDAIVDPTCYPGSGVLKNLPDLRSQAALDRFEKAATGRRFNEPMPAGRFSLRHYRAVHHHIFQDVYPWAGRSRTIRVSKGDSTFCYPEHIEVELRRTFTWLSQQGSLRRRSLLSFASEAAHFAAELNAIHPFRDGNGRTQLAFMTLLAEHAGHPFELERLDPSAFLAAMIASFHGDENSLALQFEHLAAPPAQS